MKQCELCGLSNPDEARFCMKCGKDLDSIGIPKSGEDEPRYDTFTPAGSEADAPLGSDRSRKDTKAPSRSTRLEEPLQGPYKDSSFREDMTYEIEPLEIEPAGVTTDFTSLEKYCNTCGSANPHDQKHCKVCGRGLEEDAEKTSPSPPGPFGTEVAAVDAERKERPFSAARSNAHAGLDGRGISLTDEIASARTGAGLWSPEKQVLCESCGNSNPPGQEHCQLCGLSLSRTGQESGPEPLQEAPYIPPETEPFEAITTLAPLRPSASQYDEGGRVKSGRRPRRAGRRNLRATSRDITNWGALQWSILIAASVIIAALIWLFAFGGAGSIFSTRNRRISDAGRAMMGLTSFRFSISVALEFGDFGTSSGTGILSHESPDRTAYDVSVQTPANNILSVRHIQVTKKPYVNISGEWEVSDPSKKGFSVSGFWSDFSSVEDLGDQVIGDRNCYHYKYRIPPETVTRLLGVWEPDGVSDAVVEAWIDKSNNQIVRLTSEVYNLKFEGTRTRAFVSMDLLETGRPYNISAPW